MKFRDTDTQIVVRGRVVVTIDNGNEARRAARKVIGKVPGTRKIADKRRKPPKHRKPLKEE